MFFKLFLIFTLIPVIELSLLIKVGGYIGVMNTIMIVILTAIAGAYMVRSEGIGVMSRIQRNMQEGIFPGDEMMSGMMILIAVALILTTGFFTDLIGFLMVIPVSREFIKGLVKQYINKHMSSDDFHIDRF